MSDNESTLEMYDLESISPYILKGSDGLPRLQQGRDCNFNTELHSVSNFGIRVSGEGYRREFHFYDAPYPNSCSYTRIITLYLLNNESLLENEFPGMCSMVGFRWVVRFCKQTLRHHCYGAYESCLNIFNLEAGSSERERWNGFTKVPHFTFFIVSKADIKSSKFKFANNIGEREDSVFEDPASLESVLANSILKFLADINFGVCHRWTFGSLKDTNSNEPMFMVNQYPISE